MVSFNGLSLGFWTFVLFMLNHKFAFAPMHLLFVWTPSGCEIRENPFSKRKKIKKLEHKRGFEKKNMSIPQNHTPHSIVLYNKDNVIAYTFPPSSPILRLMEKTPPEAQMLMGDINITVSPPPEYACLSHVVSGDILVSQLVAQYLVDHPEWRKFYDIRSVYSPDTGPNGAVRNLKGEIVGTRRLIKYI